MSVKLWFFFFLSNMIVLILVFITLWKKKKIVFIILKTILFFFQIKCLQTFYIHNLKNMLGKCKYHILVKFSIFFFFFFFFRNLFGMIPQLRRLLLVIVRYVDRYQYQTQTGSLSFTIFTVIKCCCYIIFFSLNVLGYQSL